MGMSKKSKRMPCPASIPRPSTSFSGNCRAKFGRNLKTLSETADLCGSARPPINIERVAEGLGRKGLAMQGCDPTFESGRLCNPCTHCFPEALEHLAKVAGTVMAALHPFPPVSCSHRSQVTGWSEENGTEEHVPKSCHLFAFHGLRAVFSAPHHSQDPKARFPLHSKRDQPVADVFGIGFVAFQLLS
jgi:hypothetical protein